MTSHPLEFEPLEFHNVHAVSSYYFHSLAGRRVYLTKRGGSRVFPATDDELSEIHTYMRSLRFFLHK